VKTKFVTPKRIKKAIAQNTNVASIPENMFPPNLLLP